MASAEKGLWIGSYAATNPDEFFAELTMWYFGTHGDRSMKGPRPENGPEGLKRYDPEAFALFDYFYRGRLVTAALPPSVGRGGEFAPAETGGPLIQQRRTWTRDDHGGK